MYEREVIEFIRDKLIDAKQTLAVAESVTAGHLQAAISSATMASEFFQGGITTYNLGQKARHLDVNPIEAERVNSVSENVAVQMALGVNRKFMSDYGISITGYAAPVPELGIDDLFAWFAISFRNEILILKKITCEKKDSVAVQIEFTNMVLREFKNSMFKR